MHGNGIAVRDINNSRVVPQAYKNRVENEICMMCWRIR